MDKVRVICDRPNAALEISGVKFSKLEDGGVISELISRETAAGFTAIPGYELFEDEEEEVPPPPPKPEPTTRPPTKAQKAAAAKAEAEEAAKVKKEADDAAAEEAAKAAADATKPAADAPGDDGKPEDQVF